jgi:hypothetical protein
LEKIKEFRISIHLLFFYFKSPYDNTDSERMYDAPNELNIPDRLMKLISMIMSDMQSQIKSQLKLSAPFKVHKETHWHVFFLM